MAAPNPQPQYLLEITGALSLPVDQDPPTGVGIGAVEAAEHSAVAALAPKGLRGSAFGMLATVQSLGNLAASTIAGLLRTPVSPTAAFAYLTAWMGVALIGLLWSARRARVDAA
ncbi:hypothetical protein [Streptomyces sp. NRRL S-448]|uniref:hypothetical protein n=1 Tax=Streptomyces sp. NRRL S-448 TaxID=1463907 RepID=UPI000A53B404